jgi:hypothetical protein
MNALANARTPSVLTRIVHALEGADILLDVETQDDAFRRAPLAKSGGGVSGCCCCSCLKFQ